MPNFEVWPTAVADRQLRDLRGETRKNAKKAMDRLERRGWEAADYHLEGDEVERFCVVDLGRDWRMIVAFPERDEVAVILVGGSLRRYLATRVAAPVSGGAAGRAPPHGAADHAR